MSIIILICISFTSLSSAIGQENCVNLSTNELNYRLGDHSLFPPIEAAFFLALILSSQLLFTISSLALMDHFDFSSYF